jgi:hypothetical protein
VFIAANILYHIIMAYLIYKFNEYLGFAYALFTIQGILNQYVKMMEMQDKINEYLGRGDEDK